MNTSKYAVVLVQIATIIVAALTAANSDGKVTAVEAFQIAGIGLGAIIAYFVPIADVKFAGIIKFVATLAGAAAAAVVPIIDTANGGPGWTGGAILIVVLAVLNAALTAWGVEVRVNAVKEALVDPTVSNIAVAATDPKAAEIAAKDVVAKDAEESLPLALPDESIAQYRERTGVGL